MTKFSSRPRLKPPMGWILFLLLHFLQTLSTLARHPPYVPPVQPLLHRQLRIFSYLPITLPQKQRGLLLGLNNTIAVVNLKGAVLGEFHWPVDKKQQKKCEMIIQDSSTECNNLIYIIQPYFGYHDPQVVRSQISPIDSFIACGSYGSATQCRTFFLKNQRQPVWWKKDSSTGEKIQSVTFTAEANGTFWFTPLLSKSSSQFLAYTDNTSNQRKLISATTAINMQDGTVESKLMKFSPEESPSVTGKIVEKIKLTQDPHTSFVKLLNFQGKTLLFYTNDQGSKIAQVCQNDDGWVDREFKEYHSFLQTGLSCKRGDILYPKLVAVGQVFKLETEYYILAGFTLSNEMDELIQSSVICVFSMNSINNALSTKSHKLKEYRHSHFSSGYDLVHNPSNYHPETCARDATSVYSLDAFKFQERKFDLDSHVDSISNEPIIHTKFSNDMVNKYKITSITNGNSQHKDDTLPFYVGTDDGHLLRYALKLSKTSIKHPLANIDNAGIQFIEKIVIEEILNDPQSKCKINKENTLSNIRILDDILLLQFKYCLVPLPMTNCIRHSACQSACESEPLCLWLENKSTCIQSSKPKWKGSDKLAFCQTQTVVEEEIPSEKNTTTDITLPCEFIGDCQPEAELEPTTIVIERQKTPPNVVEIPISPPQVQTASHTRLMIIVSAACLVFGVLAGVLVTICMRRKNKSLAEIKTNGGPPPALHPRESRGESIPFLDEKPTGEGQSSGYASNATSQGSDVTKRTFLSAGGHRKDSESSTPGGANGNVFLPFNHIPHGIPSPDNDNHPVPYISEIPIFHGKQESNVSKSEYRDKLPPLPGDQQLSQSWNHTMAVGLRASSYDSQLGKFQLRRPVSLGLQQSSQHNTPNTQTLPNRGGHRRDLYRNASFNQVSNGRHNNGTIERKYSHGNPLVISSSNTKLAPVSPAPTSPGYKTMTLDRNSKGTMSGGGSKPSPIKVQTPRVPFYHTQTSLPNDVTFHKLANNANSNNNQQSFNLSASLNGPLTNGHGHHHHHHTLRLQSSNGQIANKPSHHPHNQHRFQSSTTNSQTSSSSASNSSQYSSEHLKRNSGSNHIGITSTLPLR